METDLLDGVFDLWDGLSCKNGFVDDAVAGDKEDVARKILEGTSIGRVIRSEELSRKDVRVGDLFLQEILIGNRVRLIDWFDRLRGLNEDEISGEQVFRGDFHPPLLTECCDILWLKLHLS